MDDVFTTRLNALQALREELRLDALLLYSNRFESRYIKWATGIQCLSAYHYLLISKNESVFFEISYRAPELKQKTVLPVHLIPEETDAASVLVQHLGSFLKIGVLGPAPFAHLEPFKHAVKSIGPNADALLSTKSPQEIALIERYASELMQAIELAGTSIEKAGTEAKIESILAAKLYSTFDRLACPTTVLSNQRLQNATVGAAQSQAVEQPHMVLIDAAATKNGLYADCTRMFFSIDHPLRGTYEKLKQVQQRAIQELVPGICCQEIVAIYKRLLTASGLPANTLTVADLGHGIGYTLHEDPFICTPASSNLQILPNTLFTLEPEIQVDGYWLRLEDMVLMGDQNARCLTTAP
jgi:Xaa-Pro aminopeptidase